MSAAKASDDHLRRVFAERFGAAPARDERLWGMLRPRPKSWVAAGSVSSARLSLGSSLSTVGGSGGSLVVSRAEAGRGTVVGGIMAGKGVDGDLR